MSPAPDRLPERIQLQARTDAPRLDRYLANQLEQFSRTAVQRLIDAGAVTLNGQPAQCKTSVQAGDQISVLVPPSPAQTAPVPEPIPLQIVYEDEYLAVVDKPPGLVVHPGAGRTGGTLVNALLHRYPELQTWNEPRPGIVHRLDQDTSGLLVVAKAPETRRQLQRLFRQRRVRKLYRVLVDGVLDVPEGQIEAPIGRHPRHRKRMAALPGGRPATTYFRVQETFAAYTLVDAEPKTGRTHQIRVHFASIGHPVAGDPVYGRRQSRLGLRRQFLHAAELGFRHPATGEEVLFRSDLPVDLAAVLTDLRAR
jgi:23S rRNA pseudouridine1911/1915/1917 synthase